MSELSETIGSMPSVPQSEPRPQTPRPKPKAANREAALGFFLCAICLLAFPTYAHTDDLGTGIFYGMGLLILLLLVAALCGAVAERVSRNKPPKALAARPGTGKPQRLWRLNSILFGVVILFGGVFLLTSPDSTNLGDLSMVGLFLLILGIGVTFTSAVGYSRDNRHLAAAEAGAGSVAQEQQQSNRIRAVFYLLLLGAFLLALPREAGTNAFDRGLFYGIGLLLLFLAMMVLGSIVSRLISRNPA